MLTVRGGYHGDTFGCMSVCDPVGGMHSMFRGVLPQQVFADRPPADPAAMSRPGPPLPGARGGSMRDELAGIIVEPVLQGAGGMFVYDAACLRVMREVADEHGLVLVFDEIATGFGRTGRVLRRRGGRRGAGRDVRRQGADRRLPHARRRAVHRRGGARAVRVGVGRADARADVHGQPAGLRRRAGQPRPAERRRLGGQVERDRRRAGAGLEPLRGLPGVADVRTLGAVGVVQLDHPVDVVKATDAAVEEGVWLRPFRDLVYTMPPYVTATPTWPGSAPASSAAVAVA